MSDMTKAADILCLCAICLLSVTIFACLVRAVIGPRFTDRIIAVNMIAVKGIVLILVSAYYMHETFFLDVALTYALISFLAVIVLSRQILKRSQAKAEAESEGAAT